MKLTHPVQLVFLVASLAPCVGSATDDGMPAAGTGADASEPHAGESIHTHVPLEIDSGMTIDAVIEAALEIYPSRFEMTARETMAAAWERQGRNLLSDAPSISFSVLNDSALDSRGQVEIEGGIELPIWRVGQKSAAGSVADAASAESHAAAAAMRLEIAGIVRSILWEIAASAQALEQARAALDVTNELVRVVEARAARGDLARADVLLARAAAFERGVAVIEHEAMLLDAERSYRALTGLDARPDAFTEARSANEDYDPSHPMLAMAMREVERANAELEYTEKSSRGTPTLTVGPRRQRDALTNFYNNSVSVGVSVPFGGRNHGAVERARASGAVAAARSNLARVERSLDLELHEAEHELFVIDESLELVTEQAELAERRLLLSRTAFEQGEIDLQELLRVQDAAIGATGDLAALRIERQRAIAALNQALGELP